MRIMELLYDFWDEQVARCLIVDGGCQVAMKNGTTLLHEFTSIELLERVQFLIAECQCEPAIVKDALLCILLRSIVLTSDDKDIDFICYLLAVSNMDPHISLDNDKTVCLMCYLLKDLDIAPHQLSECTKYSFITDSFLMLICKKLKSSIKHMHKSTVVAFIQAFVLFFCSHRMQM